MFRKRNDQSSHMVSNPRTATKLQHAERSHGVRSLDSPAAVDALISKILRHRSLGDLCRNDGRQRGRVELEASRVGAKNKHTSRTQKSHAVAEKPGVITVNAERVGTHAFRVAEGRRIANDKIPLPPDVAFAVEKSETVAVFYAMDRIRAGATRKTVELQVARRPVAISAADVNRRRRQGTLQ